MKNLTLLVLLGSIILTGCQSGFTDMSRELPIREIYHLTIGGLFDIVWPESQTIIMDIDEGNFPKIAAFDIKSHEMKPINIESACKKPLTRSLQVLPNRQAGFVLDCREPKSQIIQEVDLTKKISSDIYVEPIIGMVGNFSYSHDMKEIILVDVNGLYLESSLYHLDVGGNRTNITADFQRADFPVWSPIGDVVAFLGTKLYSDNDEPKNWRQIENLFDYPWKLYLYSLENRKIDELPLEIMHPSRLKWSPDGKYLAFAGEYKGLSGVWIVSNLDTSHKLTITRIVEGSAVFDFSPDSKSLAFAYGTYSGQENKEKQNTIYALDIPEQITTP